MLVAMARSGRFGDHRFLLCFEGRLARELREASALVQVLPPARTRNPLSILRFRRALAYELARAAPEQVVCHGVWSYCMGGATARRHGVEPTLFLHDLPEARKLLYRWAWLQPPKRCIANSEFVRAHVAELGGAVRTFVVHPLVPSAAAASPAEVRALRAGFGVGDDELVILQASRLDPWKGHRTLLRALAELKDVPGWQAWIAGAPQREEEREYVHELEQLIGGFGLARRVRFIGHRSDMSSVLAACDVYCQPNEHPEPFGMVFVEALTQGKPVIAGNQGGVLEIVTSACGMLLPSDPSAVASGLRALLQDSARRRAMGEAAQSRATGRWGAEAFAKALDEALRAD